MAALQGANMVGADVRCASNGTSSLFAFVKVAQSSDIFGSPSFNISVRTHSNSGIEPIDSLQNLFDLEHNCNSLNISSNSSFKHLISVKDLLGRKRKKTKNEILIYLYDDGTVEKKIIID